MTLIELQKKQQLLQKILPGLHLQSLKRFQDFNVHIKNTKNKNSLYIMQMYSYK